MNQANPPTAANTQKPFHAALDDSAAPNIDRMTAVAEMAVCAFRRFDVPCMVVSAVPAPADSRAMAIG